MVWLEITRALLHQHSHHHQLRRLLGQFPLILEITPKQTSRFTSTLHYTAVKQVFPDKEQFSANLKPSFTMNEKRSLESLNFDNQVLQRLPIDDSLDPNVRTVCLQSFN